MEDEQYKCKNGDIIELDKYYEDFYGDKVRVLYICSEDEMNFDEEGYREPFFVLRKKPDGTIKHHFIPMGAFMWKWEGKSKLTPIHKKNAEWRGETFSEERESHKFLSLDVSKEFDTITINLK